MSRYVMPRLRFDLGFVPNRFMLRKTGYAPAGWATWLEYRFFFLPYTCIQTLGTGQENKVHQDQGKVKEFHSKSGKIYVPQRG